MPYKIHCYLTKFPHVETEKYNTNKRILRYKIFTIPTKNVGKKREGMSYRIHFYLTKFPNMEIEKYNTNNRILHYKIFPTKNVANGGTLKYFQQKMLQKYRRPNQQKFGK